MNEQTGLRKKKVLSLLIHSSGAQQVPLWSAFWKPNKKVQLSFLPMWISSGICQKLFLTY